MKAAAMPLTHAVSPSKQGARRHYGSHPYFTKRAWNVVQEYIRHFSAPGETVLDPFGGSGVTAVESLVLKRKALYVDVSEWACFLARQTAIAPVDLSALMNAFGEVEDKARPFIEALWKCDEEALAQRAVADWYPRGIRLPSNADVETVDELFTPRMLHGLARLRAAIMTVADCASRELLLLAFSATLVRINRTFLSANNRAESRGGSAIFSIYRYKVAKQAVELPLWKQFARRFARLTEAKRETNELIGKFYDEPATASFIHGSATQLTEHMQEESVDYIYTDPPYGAHISYLDLSTMWTAWLGLNISPPDRTNEVIEGGELRKSRETYHQLLADSLARMAAVLKRGRWLSLVFAHRDTAYWEMLVDACADAGFEYVNTVVQPVGVVWSMHKKKNPLRVLSGELVLNFRKATRKAKRVRRSKDVTPLSVVRNTCEWAIVEHKGRTTEELHHAVVPALLETGLLTEFSRSVGDLTPFLEAHFEFDDVSRKWHLRSDQVLSACPDPQKLVAYHVFRLLQQPKVTDPMLTQSALEQAVERRINGTVVVTREMIGHALSREAFSPDGRHWRLREVEPQFEFLFAD